MFSPILRQLDLANALTLTGLFLSFLTVIFAVSGSFNLAIVCLIYAGIIDLFDGLVARNIQRTELQAEAGQELDSLVDLCSFGLSPALFAYCFGLQDIVSIVVLIFYLGANALRLSYFNTQGLAQQEEREYFTGLPVTYAALFIPIAFLARFVFSPIQMKLVLDSVYVLLAIAMVANFKMLKLRGIWYGIFAVGALMLTGVYGWAALAEI